MCICLDICPNGFAQSTSFCNCFHFTANTVPPPCDDSNLEGYTLLQDGEKLNISALVKAKKYKGRGNKAAAVEACKKLQEKGFGKLLELGSSRGTSMVRTCYYKNILVTIKIVRNMYICSYIHIKYLLYYLRTTNCKSYCYIWSFV